MLNNIKQAGVTLIELIIAMVIISIALGGILSVVNQTTAHSADPVVNHQAVAIAESYLEEILLLPVTMAISNVACSAFFDPGNSRKTFDKVEDYDCLINNGASDQNTTTISGLENYTVTVDVKNDSITNSLDGGVTPIKEINVTVTRGSVVSISIKGYRAEYL